MKNKGFTLIELLAVIVILAIIALIATPVILGIIEDSQKSARENSAKYIISTLQTSYATAYMKADATANKEAGQNPTLAQVLTEMDKNIDKATVNSDNKTITSEDGVKCWVTSETVEGKTGNYLKADCYVAESTLEAEPSEGAIASIETDMQLK